ncbi:MAG: hypothetical protein IJ125_03355 [Atopobiaceae bacterium]|nr:hypothetical protein [Atopobiaceae bacterium]
MLGALSLGMVGCGGAATSQGASAEVPAVEQLSKASGSAMHFNEANKEATVDVTIAQGESLVMMSDFDMIDSTADTAKEITAIVFRDGEELSSDYFYEGLGYSAAGVDPGDYSVKVDAAGATGTLWVLAYPADSIDVDTMDTEDIIQKVLSDVS